MRKLSFFQGFFISFLFSNIFFIDPVWAAGSGAGISRELVWQFVSFTVLIILLGYFLKDPFRSFLGGRKEEIKTSLERMSLKVEELEVHLEEWKKKIQQLDQEILLYKQKIVEEGEIERRKIIERAEEEGNRIQKQTALVAEQEVKKARGVLKKELVDLSMELTENILKNQIRFSDQERLLGEYLGKVKEQR